MNSSTPTDTVRPPVTAADGAGSQPFDLRGRRVLVTGAVGGLGREMATALAAAGAAVAVHHLGQDDEAQTLCRQIEDAGGTATSVGADVTSWDQVERMVDVLENDFGPIDALVNNAGYMVAARFTDMSLADWQRTMDVDLTGVFLCSRLVVPRMLARGQGAIVNVSSQLAFKGAHNYVSYCAAKAGVVGLTHAMARELGPQIRVNAIAPGPVETAFIAPYDTPEWRHERTRDLVIGRLAYPAEVAPAVVFLVSDAASLLHGQTLHINGGGVMA